jgi:hypothetical protein
MSGGLELENTSPPGGGGIKGGISVNVFWENMKRGKENEKNARGMEERVKKKGENRK